MSRRAETSIPILLWISAAAVVHYGSFHGADAVADVGIGKMEMRSFAAAIRNGLRPSTSPFEVTFEVDSKTDEKAEEKPDEPKIDPMLEPKKPEKAEKKPEKPPEKKPEKKPEPEKKLVLPQMTAAPPPPPPPPPPADKRTAIDQHVEDKKQKDNPDAQFISDNANHVKEETVAKITSHDRNDKDPTLSKSHSSADKEAGDADKTKVADSDDRPGEAKQTPGEKSATKNDPLPSRQGQASAAKAVENEPKPANVPPADKAGQGGKPGPKGVAQPVVPPPPVPQPAPQPTAPPKASPDVQAAPKGNYIINPFSGGSDSARPDGSAMPKVPPAPTTQQVFSMPKLGGGPGPRGVNFNLTTGGALAAIGTTNLAKEREAEGEMRRSAHRGAYKPASLDRWRAAITNYVASVKPGNQTALNTAQSPFGTYLHHIHNRIHPIFADDFLDSLDGRFPANHPINESKLVTWLEIVVDGETGKLVKMGVVRASGVTAFDVAALDAVDRAAGKAGFGKPPAAILSTDGNVYFHWEFHRDRPIACGTQNARPYLVNVGAPKTAPSGSAPVGPRAPEPPREK
jgi:hypothetical protein